MYNLCIIHKPKHCVIAASVSDMGDVVEHAQVDLKDGLRQRKATEGSGPDLRRLRGGMAPWYLRSARVTGHFQRMLWLSLKGNSVLKGRDPRAWL